MKLEGRRCGRCGEIKPLAEFAWRRKAKGQRHNYCRPCHAEYHREHYLANRRKYIDLAKKRAQLVAEERYAFLIEYFRTNPCADCGETDPVVLEFDHLGDKKFNVAKGIRDRSWESLLAEIAKCDVVCSNCHRRRTARRAGHVRAALAQGSGGGGPNL
jgi:hypothetical protein